MDRRSHPRPLALVGILAFLGGSGRLGLTGAGADSGTVTVIETHTLPRAAQPAQQAGESGEPGEPGEPNACAYSHYAAGNGVTSGPFAANVYSAFLGACADNGGPDVTVDAYSPKTKLTYTMSCAGSARVYCRGGENAVVEIW
ncbi:hypothetical protein [Corynebacterium lipophiloflavum]|uniref:Uncharacterized protein n=1 Tax=Corynebacterium lipophiloflavum (strain ATCC 700352 / DSM 44291 / CCUG 37336 / JCM 10383 / DMMZ 1944) TaxID=525263 RepID=C0XQ75_CORLD|nr:hypothetical protein [Corynebacterium lipophiloflavum]EEI17563.1 hypothetical protein HMPREF0298_0595 [Corynebacterium lipophiloflavum DSM 44291]